MPKRNRKVVTPVAAPIPTVIEFLLDETGSMNQFLTQTLAGFQTFVDEQKTQVGECYFTLTKFDTTGFKTPYIDLDIRMVPYLTQDTFLPNDRTNLRDAIVERLAARKALLSTWDIKPRMLFVCLTDGADNASRKSENIVRDLITSTMVDEDWAFIYLGAYPGAKQAALSLGFPPTNIRCFEGTRIDTEMQDLAGATKAYRAGMTSASDFYGAI